MVLGFFDDIIGGVLDVGESVLGGIGDFLGTSVGGSLLNTGLGIAGDLVSPAVSEWIYGSTTPADLMTPEQREAVELSNRASRFQYQQAMAMLPYATPGAWEGITAREAARNAYEADLVRRRQLAQGKKSPYLSNYYDNMDPIVRRALDARDPVSQALAVRANAANVAAGVPNYVGAEDLGYQANAINRAQASNVQDAIGEGITTLTPVINNWLRGDDDPYQQITGFDKNAQPTYGFW